MPHYLSGPKVRNFSDAKYHAKPHSELEFKGTTKVQPNFQLATRKA